MNRIYFVTMNQRKLSEAEAFVEAYAAEARQQVTLCHVPLGLTELMTADIEEIVRSKAVEAYRHFGLPCVVEHSGLFLKALHNLPGVLGGMIWHSIGERMCGFVAEGEARDAVARSVVGYCDGRRVRLYPGETPGRIAERPSGEYDFCWDTIFIPEGHTETYGDLGFEGKRATSPAAQAWHKFLADVLPRGRTF